MKRKNSIFVESTVSKLEREQVQKEVNQIRELLDKARYKQAFQIAKNLYKKFPENRYAQYRYAVSLGDCDEWAAPNKVILNQKTASRILKNLLRKTRGIDPRWRSYWRNEYYWFSKQPMKQWRLGLSDIRSGISGGQYSMGVGAVSVSLQCFEKRKITQGKIWARKAQDSWEQYFRITPNYYNAYVWYAQALGLQGDVKGMETALKRAAKISKRSIRYSEFTEAKKKVMAALGQK